MSAEKVIAIVCLEDKEQDVQRFTIEFYPDFRFGRIIDADMQRDIWTEFCVLSGKPTVGQCLVLSKSPNDIVLTLRYKAVSVEFKD